MTRITLAQLQFNLFPKTIHREIDQAPAEQHLDAVYVRTHRQVFGSSPAGTLGKYREKVVRLAKEAGCSVPLFMLASMFGHFMAFPDESFTAGRLVDNRALHRVRTYAAACREKFASFDAQALDALSNEDNHAFDLTERMLRSEITAGRYILNYKLRHGGAPYEALFDACEDQLDPAWLAIEPHYEPILLNYSKRIEQAPDRQDTRHAAHLIFQRLKRHRHDAISHFLAREQCLPRAIAGVLQEFQLSAADFEIEKTVQNDALRFWHRLALAMQHLECLLYLHDNSGTYAASRSIDRHG